MMRVLPFQYKWESLCLVGVSVDLYVPVQRETVLDSWLL